MEKTLRNQRNHLREQAADARVSVPPAAFDADDSFGFGG
jgi:hypothetical protein